VLANRWFMLGLIFLARTSMALQFQSIAPVAPLLVADLALSYAQVGVLIGLYLLPGTVLALPGGLLGQWFGNRRVALWGLGLMLGGGLITAGSSVFWIACAGRVLSGAGGVLLNLILAKMTAEWFAGKEISTAMSIMLAAWPLGIGLGTACLGGIAAAFSWRSVQYLTAAGAALSLVLTTLFYRDAPSVKTSDAAFRFWPHLSAHGWRVSLAAGMAWMLFNVGFIVLVGFGPGVLVAQGASLANAGFVVSLAVWVGVISVPLGGVVTDRAGRPNLAIALGCLAGALATVAVPLLPFAAVWFLVAGVMMGLPPGAILALVPGSVKADHLAAAFGVFYATYYLGMATLLPVAGLLRDLTGSPAAPVFFAAAIIALTVIAVGALRWVNRRSPS